MRFQIALLAVFLFSGTGIFLPSSSAQTTSARVIALKTPAPVVSENFVVHATDPTLAAKVSSEAERFRKELALQWLGRELEPWDQKCPITVEVGMHAGGETSFAFIMDNSGGQTSRLADENLWFLRTTPGCRVASRSDTYHFRDAFWPSSSPLGRRRSMHNGGARFGTP